MSDKIKIAYVCVHNSCRSQMAEAITRQKYSEIFEVYSAGTKIKDQINQDAVKTINEMYNIDMNSKQKSKLISDIPEIEVLITMGCNVDCPHVPNTFREDWGLDDPTGESNQVFKLTAKLIEEKIDNLVYRIKLGLL